MRVAVVAVGALALAGAALAQSAAGDALRRAVDPAETGGDDMPGTPARLGEADRRQRPDARAGL